MRLPVSDVLRSRDWYQEVLGFNAILDFEEEDRLVGVALEHPGGVNLGLHLEPERAQSLRGFALLALRVTVDDLERWAQYLDQLGVEHSPILKTDTGQSIRVADPNGIVIQLHTPRHPVPDEA